MTTESSQFDYVQLTKDLDRTKSGLFKGRNAAFFAPLLCSLHFVWDESIGTAATDGESIMWNPAYFLKLPPPSRLTDLMHELWHVAWLHGLRCNGRHPGLWNIACDIKIDLNLEAEGYSFDGIEGVLTWKDLDARRYGTPWTDADGKPHDWVEETIYDDLVTRGYLPPKNQQQDILSGTKTTQAQMLANVVQAMHQAHLGGGGAGKMPGNLEALIKAYLAPVVPWEILLHRWMTELAEETLTWQRPNRRYGGSIYLPSRKEDIGRLTHLVWFEDVSGSISNRDLLRFHSEQKYVKDKFDPPKMTLVQFDTRISQTIKLDENSTFEELPVKGRGGTCLRCVREWIIENKPTAAVIFSDLECPPMEALPVDIPILWICVRNRGIKVPFGQLVHVR